MARPKRPHPSPSNRSQPPSKSRRIVDIGVPIVTRKPNYVPQGRDSASPIEGDIAVVSGALPSPKKTREEEDSVSEESDEEEEEEEEEREANGGAGGRHIRFGGDEVPSVRVEGAGSSGSSEEEDEDEDEEGEESSDDEAPEAVTKAAAQTQSRSVAAGIAKALKRERLKEKTKRRAREEKLKENSKLSNAKRKRIEKDSSEEESEESEDETQDQPSRARGADGRSVPDLLPEELLTDDLFKRPPTPEKEEQKVAKTARTSKKQLLDVGETAPKDIQVGPVRVSVLEKSNPLLPPKANAKSKSVRENWLAGRRGAGSGVRRKKMNTSFFRR